jgi:hypothetical protein
MSTGTKEKVMAKKKREPIRVLNVRPGATLKEIYAQARKEFTAADLQKFTEIEEMIPAEEVLADMDRILQEELAKQKKRRKRA